MNTSSHDKSLADHHQRPQFELTPLDSRRQSDHSQNYRDSNFDPSYRVSQSRTINHPPPVQTTQGHLHPSTSNPMKSTVIHQQQPHSAALTSMQPYPGSSMGFSSIPDTQQSANSSFPIQSNGHRLPNTMSLHQPPHSQHQPHPQHPSHAQHQQQPSRTDAQPKMAPPQHNTMRRYLPQQRPSQQINTKPSEQVTNVQQGSMLPHMQKVQPSIHMMSQPGQQVPPRFQQHGSQAHLPSRGSKGESIPSMPLPMHPDPVQSFQPSQEVNEGDRGFTFGRHSLFEEFSQEEHPNPVGMHPPHTTQDTDQGNTLAGVDSITGHLGMPGVASISNLPLPGITGGQGAPLHGVTGFGTPTGLGNAAIAGGASEIAETLGIDRKAPPHQRRVRAVPRVRSQHMTESQRKQRHNEHTRASRSRIDKGLERLKNTIRKVKPHQKVTKKADVLQEAVKIIKEGYRLPATESDEEREDPPQDSSLSV